MKKPTLDITPFRDKYNRLPEADRIALWTFNIEGDTVSCWGTLAEASSTASLYAHANAIEDAVFLLVDYCPVPRRVFSVRCFDN
jgi:hypothetical protein